MFDKFKVNSTRWLYIGGALLALYVVYRVTSGFLGFLVQILLYLGLTLALLIYLKRKGFFK